MFEWRKTSQNTKTTPDYDDLLDFLDLSALASETSSSELKKHHSSRQATSKSATSLTANAQEVLVNCSLCKTLKHPLYTCPQFKLLPHDKILSTIHSSNVCLNCLKPGHFSKSCASNYCCKKCQKPHHTLLHCDSKSPSDIKEKPSETVAPSTLAMAPMVSSCAQSGSGNVLLMTCQMLVHAPNDTCVWTRGLLDSSSSTSFISERLAQSLRLPLATQHITITGIIDMSHGSLLQSIATLKISPLFSSGEKLQVSAIVIPWVTCDLLTQPVHLNTNWSHLNNLHLADPTFGQPSKVDVLLGVDIYADILLHGQRSGPCGTRVAFETKFGWVLTGKTEDLTIPSTVTSLHVTTISGNDILRKFWEIEECPRVTSNHSPEECTIVRHFAENHRRNKDGRFVVPLPRDPQANPLGESRSPAVRRFLSL